MTIISKRNQVVEVMEQFIQPNPRKAVNSCRNSTFLGQRVAVKAMQKGKIQDYEAFKNEIAILKMLVCHKLIAKINFRIILISLSCTRPGKLTGFAFLLPSIITLSQLILFRLCEGGELFFHITKKKHLTEAQAASIMKQAFYALCYLHKSHICHRYFKQNHPLEILSQKIFFCIRRMMTPISN